MPFDEKWPKIAQKPKLAEPKVKKLSARQLAEALTAAVTDTQMRHRAAALGEKIRAEGGVQRAIEAIHLELVSHGPKRRQS
jgi:sterol 3beta-glucosyltransferase